MHYDYNFVVTLTLTQPKTNSCFSSRISAYIFGMFPNSNFTLNLLFILNTVEVRCLSLKTFKSVYWIVFQTNICEASQAKLIMYVMYENSSFSVFLFLLFLGGHSYGQTASMLISSWLVTCLKRTQSRPAINTLLPGFKGVMDSVYCNTPPGKICLQAETYTLVHLTI